MLKSKIQEDNTLMSSKDENENGNEMKMTTHQCHQKKIMMKQ